MSGDDKRHIRQGTDENVYEGLDRENNQYSIYTRVIIPRDPAPPPSHVDTEYITAM